MAEHEVADPDFERRVRESFGRQRFMRTLGAEMTRLEPGVCEIEVPYDEDWTQQHGYLHAGVSTAIADSAGGYAAYSLMPADASILAVEFKVSLVNPARGERFRARGTVEKAGRRLTVCRIEVEALAGGEVRTCLLGLQTNMCLPGESDRPGR